MYHVRLTEEQRDELKLRSRAAGVMPRTRDRLEMVRLSDAGWSIPVIARHLRISEQRVRFWIKRFLAQEFDGLPDQPHPGQSSALTPALAEAIRTELRKAHRTWTAPQLTAWLRAHHGVQLTPGWLAVLLERAGIRYKRTTRTLKHKQDAAWDADQVRDDLRRYVVEHLGDPAGVLVVDETGFLKKGQQSVGVQRQYSGTAGRIENCQCPEGARVFLAYVTPQGRTFLDRELYLPREWAEAAERRQAAGVPEAVAFATKPQLAQRMLQRVREAGVPAAWVTADAVYGGDRKLRLWLEAQGPAFVLEVACKEPLWAWPEGTEGGPRQVRADRLAEQIRPEAWKRLSAGAGAKGPRLYDWARRQLFRPGWPDWEHWLLVRRSLRKPEELAYYVVFAPEGTPLAELVRVAGSRWAIEEGFESAKGEVRLDQYEVRKWDAWYRFITLALLAHAYLTVLRHHARLTDEKGGWASAALYGERSGSRTATADRTGSAPLTPRNRVEVGTAAGAAPPLVALATAAPDAGQTVS